jgi:hypothetical protein
MKQNSISIKRKLVSVLLRCIDEGRFAIPKLQREFVWDGPKAAKLLDSIQRQMPIGVVMIWETPKAQRLNLRQKYHVLPPFNTRNAKVWFLIDGQQRISVIHHVRVGGTLRNSRGKEIDFSRVVLSLEKDEDGQSIQYRKPIPERFVSLSDVLHPHWKARFKHLSKSKMARVQQCRKNILRYPIHLMYVEAQITDIREAFLRINTQGMKITTADAIFTRAETLDLRDFRHEVQQHLDEGFRDIPEMPILFAMAAVRGAKEVRGTALMQVISGLEKEAVMDRRMRSSLEKDWSRLSRCFGKAVDFLRQNFSVVSRNYLYSDYIVPMLALFFYWNGRGPSTPQREQINKWFWATAVGSRYSGRDFLRCIPDDLNFFKRLARNPQSKFLYRPQVEKREVRRSQYASRSGITSAFYCLMMKLGPVSIMDDGLNEIPLDRYSTNANRKDRHHIFPQAVVAGEHIPAKDYNSICNICLLTAEENQTIGFRRPRSYLGEVKDGGTHFSRKMARHLIPVHSESGVWISDVKRGFSTLLKERNELLCKALEEQAGIRLFRRDT